VCDRPSRNEGIAGDAAHEVLRHAAIGRRGKAVGPRRRGGRDCHGAARRKTLAEESAGLVGMVGEGKVADRERVRIECDAMLGEILDGGGGVHGRLDDRLEVAMPFAAESQGVAAGFACVCCVRRSCGRLGVDQS
ncbi:MAG: hypothetical protein ACK56F_03735, partial [bacterium]